MVLKPTVQPVLLTPLFENDVKMYGTQTPPPSLVSGSSFENDVKMYGTQTYILMERADNVFENDVKMYGTQTICKTR